MAHTRISVLGRVRALLHRLPRFRTAPDLLDTLPEGLSDHHLRDIGLTRQQIYLYRHRTARQRF